MMTEERLWTVNEVAEFLRVQPTTVLRRLRSKAIRGFHLGNTWRIADADLQSYLQSLANLDSPGASPEKPSGESRHA